MEDFMENVKVKLYKTVLDYPSTVVLTLGLLIAVCIAFVVPSLILSGFFGFATGYLAKYYQNDIVDFLLDKLN